MSSVKPGIGQGQRSKGPVKIPGHCDRDSKRVGISSVPAISKRDCITSLDPVWNPSSDPEAFLAMPFGENDNAAVTVSMKALATSCVKGESSFKICKPYERSVTVHFVPVAGGAELISSSVSSPDPSSSSSSNINLSCAWLFQIYGMIGAINSHPLTFQC